MLDYVFDVFFFKQKTAYELRISDWSSDVCSSDLVTFTAEVTVDHPMPAHQQVAESLAIPRQFFAIVADNFHVHPENCSALLLHDEIGRASCRERVCQ